MSSDRPLEVALKESEERLRFLVGHMPAVVWTTDRELRFTSSMGAALEALRLRPGEVVGRTLFEYFQTNDPSFTPIAAHRRALEGTPANYQVDRSGRTFQVQIHPLREREGRIIGTIGVALDTTDLVCAEAAARLESEKSRAIVEHATDSIYIKDVEGRYLMINPAGAAYFGLPVEAIVGRRDRDLFPAEEIQTTEEIDQEVIRTGKPVNYVRPRRFRGQERVFLNSKLPYRAADGGTLGLIGISRDVTERVRAEEELKRFRELIDYSTDAICVVDPATGRYLDVNARACDLFGYEREELLEMRVWDIEQAIPDEEAWKGHMKRTNASEVTVFAGQARRKDGTLIPIEATARRVVRDRREYLVATVRDITERVRLEAELVEVQRHYQELYDSAPVMLLEVDRDGTILDCNRQVLELLGYERGQIGGRPFAELLGPDSKAQGRRLLKSLQETGRAAEDQITLLTRDGADLIAEVDAKAARDASGSRRFSMRDITARVLQERALADARRQLEVRDQVIHAEKLRALGEMVSGIAHELNNPLGAITGFTEILLRREKSEELRLIHQEAQRCARIVTNLLRFARRSPPEKTMVDVRRILEETLELRAYHFLSKGVTVVRELADRLPSTWADESQIAQVFLNVINNAEDAVAGRGAAGQIRIRAWAQDERIFVSFGDNGSGIPKDRLRQIFDPFFTTKEPGHGTGLGLSVAYGIVQDHRGRITAESEVGIGTTITVELPVRQESTRLVPRRESLPPAVAPGRRILVVEDEASMRKLLHDVLTLEQHVVVESPDGPTALRLLEEQRFDLVISDIKMPRMSGRELYEHLRRSQPALAERIIFITGDMLNPATREFLQTTPHRVLEKPCSIDRIRREVAAALVKLG
jgi:PAS domain S-box-containing protein